MVILVKYRTPLTGVSYFKYWAYEIEFAGQSIVRTHTNLRVKTCAVNSVHVRQLEPEWTS